MRRFFFILLATPLLSALVCVAGNANAAGPSPFGRLDLTGDWQVGTVEAQGSSYCAMVGRYQKDVVLAIARDPQGMGSIAIDFPQAMFKAGKKYDITLRTSRDRPRRFTALASGSHSVVVVARDDRHFFDALKAGQDLEIGVPAVGTAFAVHDFTAAFNDLDTCATKVAGKSVETMPLNGTDLARIDLEVKDMQAVDLSQMQAASKAPAPVAEMPSTPQPVQKAAVDDAQAKEQERLAALERERDSLRRNLEQALAFNTMTVPQAEKAEALQVELNQAEQDKKELAERLAVLERQHQETVNRLTETQRKTAAASDEAKDLEALQSDLSKKQVDIDRLQAQMQRNRTKAADAAAKVAAPEPQQLIAPATAQTAPAADAQTSNRAAAFLDKVMSHHRKGAEPVKNVKDPDEGSIFGKKGAMNDVPAEDNIPLQAEPAEKKPVQAGAPVKPAPPQNREDPVSVKVAEAPVVLTPPAKTSILEPVQTASKHQGIPVTLETLLVQAGVHAAKFQPVEGAPGEVVRQWRSGKIMGMYEETSASGKDFAAEIQTYIDRYREDCPRELQVSIGRAQAFDAGTYGLAEITCPIAANDYSTSLVFLQQGTKFGAVLHSGRMADSAVVRSIGENIAYALGVSGGVIADSAVAKTVAESNKAPRQLKFNIPDAPAGGDAQEDMFETIVIQ